MMDTQVGNPNAVYLLAFAALAVLLAVWAAWATARDRQRFASSEVARRLLPKSRNRWIFAGLQCVAITLFVLGLMDIRWGKSEREVQQEGYEIMFAVDVSRSMLAADASPNRLERAKQQIIAMLDEMDNDRIGLVAFAGSARQVVPLTRQYDEFISSLSELTPDSVDLGGSQLGLALETAANGFLDKTGSNRTIVLFSDGEDQDSSPADIARQLRETEGARVFTIGLGDEQRGARIPNHRARFRDFVRYQGQVVYSKLESAVLKEIASESDGIYIPAGTQRINMSDFYHRFIASEEKTSFESATFSTYTPRYLWFLIPALCILCLDLFLGTQSSPTRKPTPAVASLAKLLLAVGVLQFTAASVSAQETDSEDPVTAAASSVEEQINLANQLIAEDNSEQAIAILNSLTTPAYRDQRDYNLGVALFRQQDFENAAAQFQQTAKSKITDIAAKSRFNLGNCFYQQTLARIENSTEANSLNVPQQGTGENSPVELLQQAIAQYRSALRLAPDNVDARRNLELAYRLLKKLQQEEEEQQQSQTQESEDQPEDADSENQEDSKQNQDADSSDQEQNREPQEQESDPQEQENTDQPQQGNDEDDSTADDSTAEESESNSEQQNQQPSDQQSEQQNQQQSPDQPSDQGDNANDTQSSSEADPQSSEQNASDEPIEGELTAKDQTDAEETDQDQNRQPQAGQPRQVDANVMTQEEAMKMLQAIRDRKLRRKFQLRERERRRRLLNQQLDGRRVEKDW